MSQQPKSLFVFAGEPSGDLHGGNLVHALRKISPDIQINGIAGHNMRAEGVTGPLKMEDFEVMGFSDVIRSLPRLIRQFFQIRDAILKNNHDATVLIDYPGFNLRMAKSLRKNGYKGRIIQYISPSVWAWGRHRVDQMAETLDMLLTIYPFETNYFTKTPLKVCYVGSPVKELIGKHHYNNSWQEVLGLPSNRPLVALFPGSRAGEIARNLPIIMDAAAMLSRKNPEAVFAVSCRDEVSRQLLEKICNQYPAFKKKVVAVPPEYTYELMRDSRCAIAKSGTVTLELALHNCPTVAVYKTSQLNRWYAKYVLKAILSHYCIVNILADKEVYPELIKEELTAERLYQLIEPLYGETKERNTCICACNELSLSLGTSATSSTAAHAIVGLLS